MPPVAKEKKALVAPGKIAPFIAEIMNDLLQELNSRAILGQPTFLEMIEMLQTSPILGTIADVIVLLAVQAFGKYEHPDEEITAFIQSNFDNMEGSFKAAIAEQISAKFFKYAVSEWSIIEDGGDWLLDTIAVLHPSYYTFRAKDRKLVDVVERSGEQEIFIPMEKLIVTVNSRHLTYGNPTNAPSDCRRAWTVWKAWKVVMSEMLVAAQRAAVPIVVGQASSDEQVTLYGPDGRTPLKDEDDNEVTISANQHLMNQLENLDNRSVISSTLESKIQALAHQTDGVFFVELLKVLERLQFLSFMFPETIFQVGEGGLGNAGLNAGHMEILMLGIDGVADQIRDELIEKPVRKLITWNYGAQETYGEFKRPEKETGDRVALLSAISNAVFQQSFSANDERVINRMMDLAGIPRTADAVTQNAARTEERITNYWNQVAS